VPSNRTDREAAPPPAQAWWQATAGERARTPDIADDEPAQDEPTQPQVVSLTRPPAEDPADAPAVPETSDDEPTALLEPIRPSQPRQAPPRQAPPRQAPPQHVPPRQAPPQHVPPRQVPSQHAPPRQVPPQAVRQRPADGPVAGRAPADRTVGAVPREPVDFQPRADLMAELDRAGGQVTVLHGASGTRGAGSTQLAAAYARARLAGDWRLVAWVSAGSEGPLLAGLAAVADAAGLADTTAKQDRADRPQLVRQWLEKDGDRCLIVFDDAEGPGLLQPLLPRRGAARVIITSRRELDLGPNVPVGGLTDEEALAFVAKRTGLADHAGAGALAAELERVPLALAHAAAVITRQNLGYQDYLERLRAVQAGRDQSGAAKTILLSLEEVRAGDQSGICVGVLGLAAVLSGAGIRRDLLHAAGQAGLLSGRRVRADLVDQALEQLADWPLLGFSLDGQTIGLHRLVSDLITKVLGPRLAVVVRRAAMLLEARANALAGTQDRVAIRDIPLQVMALAETARQAGLADQELNRALLRLRFFALYYLIELGDSAPHAVTVGEPLTADLERTLGPDHPDTMNARNSLAAAYQAAGRPAEAVPLFERTLVGRERLLGPEHPDTLTTQNNLAAAYQDAGRAGEARLLFELTLAARERLLGSDDPSTLNSRGNLAAAYREAGRTAEAIRLLEHTLAGRERVLGADHPDTVTTRNNLAAAYREADRIEEAVPLAEQILAVRERLLGADHPSTLSARHNLAAAYREAGRLADAVPLEERTLAACERLLGSDHPRTLGSRNSLANAYREAGRVDEAISLHEQTLAACERLLGADHARTLGARNNLAADYQEAGRTTEAIRLYEQTLADRERVLGYEHPGTVATRESLALIRRDAGRAGLASRPGAGAPRTGPRPGRAGSGCAAWPGRRAGYLAARSAPAGPGPAVRTCQPAGAAAGR
jgi:tetratricopeptide (TPR) repeat protein